MSTVLPNSFSTPNVFVDKAMYYLSGDEYKVLVFAVRHILGWRDSFERGSAVISLKKFEDGFKTRDGELYLGVGMGKPAIIKALQTLVEYRLLKKVGNKPSELGQLWAIGTDPDWSGLEQRRHATSAKQKLRTKTARQALQSRHAGLSDNTSAGLSDNTGGSLSDNTSAGLSDNTHINPHANPLTNPQKQTHSLSADADGAPDPQTVTDVTPVIFREVDDRIHPDVPSQVEPLGNIPRAAAALHDEPPAAPAQKRAPKTNAMYDAIKSIWGYEAAYNGEMAKMLAGKSKHKAFKAYNLETPIDAADLTVWASWYRMTELRGDDSLNMVADRMKIQSSITAWQKAGKPVPPTAAPPKKQQPKPPQRPEHRIRSADDVPPDGPYKQQIRELTEMMKKKMSFPGGDA